VESIAKIRRMYHVDGKGIKTIARTLGVSRNTVRKVIRSDETKFELTKYTKDKPVLGSYLETLNQLLTQNTKEPLRRRMTARKIYQQIVSLGYSGSYESVNLVVRNFRRTHEARAKQQVFIQLHFEQGEAFQFDWGEEEICLAGSITRVKAARIKLCHSRHSLVVVYPNEQLEMVMAAHSEAFKFFGGIPKQGIYDNMRTAVSKILLGKNRVWNERFLEMASHYLFEPTACSPASGWEKGQVEKQVGDTRCNFFTPVLKGETYEEINFQLQEMCLNWSKSHMHPELQDQTIFEVYEEEKSHLIEYRGEFEGYKIHPTVVSPLSLVQYDSNMYSVSCEYAGLSVVIKVYAWNIIIIHDGKVIGEHLRSFKRNQKIYNPMHYISALLRKPGALRNGAPFKELMGLLPSVFTKIRNKLKTYEDGDKQFITILLLSNKFGMDKVTEACTLSLNSGSCSAKIVEKYLSAPQSEESIEHTGFIQLQDPPDDDCTVYSKLYLTEVKEVSK